MSMPAESLSPGISLEALLPAVGHVPAIRIHDITSDSRRVTEGCLFIATPGVTTHGLRFADQAIARGAVAIAYDPAGAPDWDAPQDTPVVRVPGLAARLGEIANRFYDSPSAAVDVYGVTGTNGKTTVAWMLSRCQAAIGRRCAYLGTLGSGIDSIEAGAQLTTPDTIELHARIADFRDQGARAAAIEISSHALDQRRVDGLRVRAALFTNLSRDHLDYHGSMRAYFEAKAKLFIDCRPDIRIINLDSEFGTELAARCGDNVVTVSTRFDRVANGRPYVFVRSVVARESGSVVRIDSSWGPAEFTLPVPGEFNVANAVLVMATLLFEGASMDDVVRALAEVSAPPGRLERVAGPGPRVYVDFAHSPAALESVLRALRPHTRGRLAVVFGAGGDRDAGKRPLMGRVAERLADRVYLTSDNPRGEEPMAIIDDIRAGMSAPEHATIVEERSAAIALAIREGRSGDTILVAGKGHEQYQEIGVDRRPFADARVAAECLRAAHGGQS